jgi:hypothetical protein
MGWTAKRSEFRLRQEQAFFFFHAIQTGSEARPASYPIGTVDKEAGTQN